MFAEFLNKVSIKQVRPLTGRPPKCELEVRLPTCLTRFKILENIKCLFVCGEYPSCKSNSHKYGLHSGRALFCYTLRFLHLPIHPLTHTSTRKHFFLLQRLCYVLGHKAAQSLQSQSPDSSLTRADITNPHCLSGVLCPVVPRLIAGISPSRESL